MGCLFFTIIAILLPLLSMIMLSLVPYISLITASLMYLDCVWIVVLLIRFRHDINIAINYPNSPMIPGTRICLVMLIALFWEIFDQKSEPEVGK